jgi:hypothetical protein
VAGTKIDFKRELRELYSTTRSPTFVEVPELRFAMVDGHGDPNVAPEYGEAVHALYSVAYTARFALKRAPDGLDYGVMPLEGLWWAPDMTVFTTADKSSWDWTMMIMQPAQVTSEVFEDARIAAYRKKSLPAIKRLRLEPLAEGRAAQVLHVGPYAAEGPVIQGLHSFIANHDCELVGKHHEIYLNDPTRTAPEKLRTILRQPVRHRGA